ncbi:UvrD-helicase domain-containing protein [Neomicrococcus aestuarii]|uniref:Uncharacterized protein n=1 Tax=Neomicrococcus aestuarii TaxID=556325 RepID=A0A1L2ZQB4_9MICC|nr:UvrD-helicase domain-containing protein [Neomicrococcus aestuarii]APF41211.1 hypothetical protein BHE16_09660 [Neomicrococcus aestuarii]
MSALEREVTEALACTRSGQDFLMSGGAGSGKTHSMLSFIRAVFAENPRASVGCITFTNVAVNEIRSRFTTSGFYVSTIHEFLWRLISRFQKNIREALAELVNEGWITANLELPIDAGFWDSSISYKESTDIAKGEVSHAEVLTLVQHLFAKHPTLSRILADQYEFLLIDEYQDTPKEVLQMLLEVLPDPSMRRMRIGFFGDGEQAIHEDGASKKLIEEAVQIGRLTRIEKKINRRNPAAVIRVINNLRTDGLIQVQANGFGAPNYEMEGSARFIYTLKSELDSSRLKELPICGDWRFTAEDTKLLYLGKAAIAKEKQFHRLMDIYAKDRAVEYAKRVETKLLKESISVAGDLSFGAVLELHPQCASQTSTQATAFQENPDLLTFAREHSFQELTSTSTNTYRLLGTKKVSNFDSRDRGEKRDALINHLMAIQELRVLFGSGKFNAVIRAIDASVVSIDERRKVEEDLKTLDQMNSSSIGDVIEFAHASGLVILNDSVLRFQQKNAYRYARVREVPFTEVVELYDYIEDHSPYSTQHGVKGSEWDNIFISLDNGGWNHYNFRKLLESPDSDESVETRSRMLLYVTCSRARKNLLVYFHSPSTKILRNVEPWFGAENVVCVD